MKRQRDDLGGNQYGHDGSYGGQMPKRTAQGVMRMPQMAPGSLASQAHRLTTNDALTYLREVKMRFSNNKEVYDTFLEIMKEFKAQRIDTTGVIQRVKDLFKGHKELVLGFNTFLPKGYEIQLADVADMDDEPSSQPKQPVEFDQAINYVNKIKSRFQQDERVYKAFLEILNMYRKGQKSITQVYDEVAVLFRNHNDLLTQFTYFLPDNSPPQGGHPGYRHLPGARGNAGAAGGGYGRAAPAAGGRARIMQAGGQAHPGAYGPGTNKRKGGRPDLGHHDEYGSGRFGGQLDREMQFFEKVKQRLRSKEQYQDFLKCLNLYAQEIISRGELINLANDIIGRFPDLMEGFNRFLARCETMDAVDNEMRGQFGSQRGISQREMARLKGQSARDKMLSKPISEVAAEINPDDRCTPSYVRVPAQFPKIKYSGRTPLAEEVLNEAWVSIISGSEDYSFKLMRKNQYEEALFRCEDDRFELDMCIETNASTLRKLRPIAESLQQLSPEERAMYRLPEDALGAIHFRAIERIYGDSGAQLIELLKKNPAVAIPVVIIRLEQKEAEWYKVREEMNKLWRKVFEQNYHKSLDHRSFYFKQSDKKSLMPKAMLQEVKDAAERRKMDDRQLQALVNGGSATCIVLQPDLTYDYNNNTVFEDVYQAVVYGIEEQLTGDARSSVLSFWHKFVEPFFGRGQRAYTPLHTKTEMQQLEAEDHQDKQSSSSDEAEEGGAGAGAKGRKGDDGAESAGMNTDAAGATPEPGTTPEPDAAGDKEGDALAALLAAGAGDLSEPDNDGEGGGNGRSKSKGASKRSRPGSDEQRQQGEGDGEEESGDGSEGGDYSNCRPLHTRPNALLTAAAAEADAAELPLGGDWRLHHVLFGNDNHYMFFRLHRHVYDRLAAAQRCARDKNQPQFRQTGDEHRKEPDPQEAAARAEEAARLHREFMGMLRRVLDGHMDSSTFEDSCRALLGTNSYVLFTLDKLIQKFIKHMATMVSDETTMRLIDLHKYEASRNMPIADEVYRANANLLMHDEPVYRFAFVEGITSGTEEGTDSLPHLTNVKPDPDHPASKPAAERVAQPADEGGQLQVQLLDPDKGEPQPLGLESGFQEYLRVLMGTPSGSSKGLFLARNTRRAGGAGGADQDPQLLDVFAQVAINNGLECKVACSNSKVSYVLDTEDVMYRRSRSRQQPDRQAAAEAVAAARDKRWKAWFELHVERIKKMQIEANEAAARKALAEAEAAKAAAAAAAGTPGADADAAAAAAATPAAAAVVPPAAAAAAPAAGDAAAAGAADMDAEEGDAAAAPAAAAAGDAAAAAAAPAAAPAEDNSMQVDEAPL